MSLALVDEQASPGAEGAGETAPVSPAATGALGWLRVAFAIVSAVAVVLYPLAVYWGLTRWSAREVALLLLVLVVPSLVRRLRRLDPPRGQRHPARLLGRHAESQQRQHHRGNQTQHALGE